MKETYYKAGFWCVIPEWCEGDSFWRYPPQWANFNSKKEAEDYALGRFSPPKKIIVVKVTEHIVRQDKIAEGSNS
jgi:hypothetical protein